MCGSGSRSRRHLLLLLLPLLVVGAVRDREIALIWQCGHTVWPRSIQPHLSYTDTQIPGGYRL